MLFLTYKPKSAKSVKAEQITDENIKEIAETFAGSARVIKDGDRGIVALKIATLDGIIDGTLGQWVVRSDDGVEMMSDADFNNKYERARGGGVFRDLREGQS